MYPITYWKVILYCLFCTAKIPKIGETYAVSESEYAPRIAFWELGLESHEARATMIRTANWKYIFHERFRPELFDLKNDPEELNDLGEDPTLQSVRKEMRDMMFESLRKRRTRTTRDSAFMRKRAENALSRKRKRPVFIGVW